MIGYVTLGTDDLDRSRVYYDALLGTIGAKRVRQFSDESPPGFRGDPKFGFYFAYFRDPDGHKLTVFNIRPRAGG